MNEAPPPRQARQPAESRNPAATRNPAGKPRATEVPTPDESRKPQPPDRSRRSAFWILMEQICRILTTVCFDLKVYGIYNIPKSGGVLLVSNHQSYLDPVLLGIGLDRTVSYMGKAELFRNPVFAWVIRSLNAFPVSQGSGDVGAVKESIARLQAGHMLNIYPEGSRTETGEIMPMEPGVGLVIRRAKVPVVPAAIVGSYDAWPKGRKFPRSRPIRVVFGPPMYDLWKKDRGEIIAIIDQTLRQMFDDLRAGRLPPHLPRPRGR